MNGKVPVGKYPSLTAARLRHLTTLCGPGEEILFLTPDGRRLEYSQHHVHQDHAPDENKVQKPTGPAKLVIVLAQKDR